MQATFTPPTTGIGPNRYLNRDRFFMMIGVAFFLHILFLIIADLLPDDEVKQVPVRALNLKLGDADTGLGVRMIPRFEPKPQPQQTAPSTKPKASSAQSQAAAPKQSVKPSPSKPLLKKIEVKEAHRKKPAQQNTPLYKLQEDANGLVIEKAAPKPVPLKPKKEPLFVPDLSALNLPKSAPAISSTPQEFVRETNTAPAHPGLANEAKGQTAAPTTEAEILKRYEQLLSAWIQRHKIYPDSAKALRLEGEPVVRIRIDRSGNVRFSSLEKVSPHRMLNIAAMEMIKRANPVPPVPNNYPGGQVLEFLIPVSYKLR